MRSFWQTWFKYRLRRTMPPSTRRSATSDVQPTLAPPFFRALGSAANGVPFRYSPESTESQLLVAQDDMDIICVYIILTRIQDDVAETQRDCSPFVCLLPYPLGLNGVASMLRESNA
jgi:hypothetical protein